ncbi:MAG: hypothetical protein IKC04_08905 [Oscillospiraceae bacterium]|nr:hypothetical protein [Oscillospiraceae bacterium]MBR2897978.1 hypothetical protein [Oscillospiraceae bacterium]MBR2977983.1 hypothetical protein [Oscillospiraceae bacterium]
MRSENGEKRAKEIRAAYQRENMKTLAVNVKKEKAARFREIAEDYGMTPSRLLGDYVDVVCRTGDVSLSRGGVPEGTPANLMRLSARNFDKLYHETSFNNPKHLNPEELLNDILRRYFKLAEELRATSE